MVDIHYFKPAEYEAPTPSGVLGSPVTATHHLALHDTEEEALEQVTDFVAPALHGQGRAIVIAWASRLRGLAGHLSDRGLQIEDLREQGRLLDLEAEQLLDAILVDGHPDETLVGALATEVFSRLAPGVGPVRIYSELAPLIWERGHIDAELELEAIWDRLEGLPPRMMMCAYPTSTLTADGPSLGFRDLQPPGLPEPSSAVGGG